jgi:hypothetical protein
MSLFPRDAHAWYKHIHLMPWAFASLPAELRERLSKAEHKAPCPPEDERRYPELAERLQLNPKLPEKLPPTAATHCVKGTPVSLAEIIVGPFVDDPDAGMDKDLPESLDPTGDRKWMGGTQGTGSQGHRHQFFPGWKPSRPVDSFQYPLRAMGIARERALAVATEGKRMIQAGDAVWGTRVLMWSLHYIQDLAQPFHADQIPSLRMLPLSKLFQWPPQAGWKALVDGTTHAITNYHWAYEGYVLKRLEEGKDSPFADCLSKPGVENQLASGNPFEIADQMAEISARLAPEVGAGNVVFFGEKLKTDEVVMPKFVGTPDYQNLSVRPDWARERHALEYPTCLALAHASWGTRRLLEWAFAP